MYIIYGLIEKVMNMGRRRSRRNKKNRPSVPKNGSVFSPNQEENVMTNEKMKPYVVKGTQVPGKVTGKVTPLNPTPPANPHGHSKVVTPGNPALVGGRPVTHGRGASRFVGGYGGMGFATTVVAPREECWDAEIEILKSCGTAPKAVEVTIERVAMAKIQTLMGHYKSIEWLAYLIGEGTTITDIVVPKQKVTSVRVDVDPDGVDVPTIGVIHSHHGMHNSFSGTDDTYINQNHGMSLCISHDGIQGHVRVETGCGKFVLVDAKVMVINDGVMDAFLEDAKKLISERTYSYVGANSYVGGHYQGNRNLGATAHNWNKNSPILGIVDLATEFTKELVDFPTSWELVDLIGYKEIVSEIIRPDGNAELFTNLYLQLLESHKFEEDDSNFCVPIELLDEMDGSMGTLTGTEHKALIELFQKLQDSIEALMLEQDEMAEDETTLQQELSEAEQIWENTHNPAETWTDLDDMGANLEVETEEGWDANSNDPILTEH